jgi:hypothetical protein
VKLFALLRALSFANSAVFTALLAFWLIPGHAAETTVFGWCHGCMWIALSVLSLIGVRRRAIPFWLAVVVALVGGVGPFAGSAGFIVETRRRHRAASTPAA